MSGAVGVGREARTPAAWLVGLGAGLVVLGGLVAAVTGPLDLAKGSWLAAYLVLVCGAAQVAMGRSPIRSVRAPRTGWLLLAGWNAGNAAVIAGTLIAQPFLVDAGGALLLVVLAVLLVGTLRRSPDGGGRHPAIRWTFAALLIVLIVSIPIGLVLAHLRA